MKPIVFLTVWMFVGISSAVAQSQPDIEKGRVALGKACVQCHNLRGIQSQRKTADQWKDTVYSMISRGGMVLPDEIDAIAAYLVANFGPNSPKPSASNQTPTATQLPDGEGRAILQRSCTQCHDLQTATGKTASREEWTQIVSRMVETGAQVTPTEQQTLIQYLTGLTR